MKYKIGDKVRIRRDLVVNNDYGCDCYIEEMDDIAKENDYILTIEECVFNNTEYIMVEGSEGCSWTDEMIEGLVTDEMIEEPTDREKFEGWMRKLSRLDSKDDTWKAFDRLTYLEADDVEDKGDFEKALKLVADYLFGVEKKKMTKAEIEAELGYSIEIVEE